MKQLSSLSIAAACLVLLGSALTGCSKQAASSDGDSLAQQRKDVMGSPAPASEQAKIAAWQAQQQQKMQNVPQTKPGSPK